MKRMPVVLASVWVTVLVLLSPLVAQAEDKTFSEAELDQMMAPIALYPDSLLAQIREDLASPPGRSIDLQLGVRIVDGLQGDAGRIRQSPHILHFVRETIGFGLGRLGPIADRNGPARRGRQPRRGGADPARATGDQQHAVHDLPSP